MENEKVIIKSKNKYKKGLRITLIVNFLLIILDLILCFLFFSKYNEIRGKWFRAESQSPGREKLYPLMNVYGVCKQIGIIAGVILITLLMILLIFYFYIANTKMVITNKQIYGKAVFGKKTIISFDSILAVDTIGFKGLAVETFLGKIKFRGISNRRDIGKVLNILIQRKSPVSAMIQRHKPENVMIQDQSRENVTNQKSNVEIIMKTQTAKGADLMERYKKLTLLVFIFQVVVLICSFMPFIYEKNMNMEMATTIVSKSSDVNFYVSFGYRLLNIMDLGAFVFMFANCIFTFFRCVYANSFNHIFFKLISMIALLSIIAHAVIGKFGKQFYSRRGQCCKMFLTFNWLFYIFIGLQIAITVLNIIEIVKIKK